eukprot:COSAG02_NODE_41864_length_390_cov_0.701031_1_plen_101_part_01
MPLPFDCPLMPPDVFVSNMEQQRAAAFQLLDDDAVLMILSCLAQSPGDPQTLARIAQCSRRLQRLVSTESIWTDLCRSEFPHARLPTTGGTSALQQCFAER